MIIDIYRIPSWIAAKLLDELMPHPRPSQVGIHPVPAVVRRKVIFHLLRLRIVQAHVLRRLFSCLICIVRYILTPSSWRIGRSPSSVWFVFHHLFPQTSRINSFCVLSRRIFSLCGSSSMLFGPLSCLWFCVHLETVLRSLIADIFLRGVFFYYIPHSIPYR